MERLRRPRTLYAQLGITAALLLLTLFLIQLVVGSYTLQLMQDRSKQQLLRPFAVEVAELIEQQQRGDTSFALLQERLFHRFHGISELGIFVFNAEGNLVNDLSFSGVAMNVRLTASRIDSAKIRGTVERFLAHGSQPLFPLYIDDPQAPERRITFAAARLTSPPGYVVVTPGGELSRVLSSISWDATGVAAAIATLLLTISGAVLLGFLLFRSTAFRFSELSRVIKRMAAGELTQRAVVGDTHDELGELLSSINNLGDALQQRQQERQLILSAVAHDLHSPIAVIAGHSELLLSSDQSSRLNSVASSIRKSALSASAMVSELLELAVLDAQADTQNSRPFDVADLLDEMVFGLQGRAQQAGVTLSAELPEEGAMTRADPLQIERVISNLVSNAIRHTPAEGSVVIGVISRVTDVEIYVRDSGEGIPADQLNSILQPYSQGAHRAQRSKGLAGLGLTICREILARHGTTLRIESTVGVGTKCLFSLPAVCAE